MIPEGKGFLPPDIIVISYYHKNKKEDRNGLIFIKILRIINFKLSGEIYIKFV